MSREWKPGDVAMVTLVGRDERQMVRYDTGSEAGWYSGAGSAFTDGLSYFSDGGKGQGAQVRPLVVIDPEDREQVERLCQTMKSNGWTGIDDEAPDDMQAVLRAFANPTPPKPEEPTGLGAAVEDSEGQVYIRTGGLLAPWLATSPTDPDRPWRYFSDIAAVKVLSEGVSDV